ncbi:MAG: transglycosylase domain-containing protein [Christensenellaceae bacterium]|jgi:membrane peptidoglycan carboxypeptidase|nr:transglycosylase domain-containing protein [Christensenellaceae bacterium]
MKKVLKFTLISLSVAASLSILFFTLLYFGALYPLASVRFDENALQYINSHPTIFDGDNHQVSTPTKTIALKNLNRHTIDAFISIEDKDFYKHHGINWGRIAKAALVNIKQLGFSEGASTISQQLIKNTHLSSEKTLGRKFNEILLTQRLEKNFNKNQILEAYLNVIYFGSNTFGINEASHRYFNKPASQLNLAESALLAGVIKSPKLYSPILEPKASLERRNLVLSEMLNDGKITKLQYDTAKKEALNLDINKNSYLANSYEAFAISEACKILNITERDLVREQYKIYTYLDVSIQKTIKKSLKDKYLPQTDSLAMVINNKTGGISGYLGTSKYSLFEIKRNPASLIKPVLVYAPALETGKITPVTPILDEPADFGNYSPSNYNGKFSGWTDTKTALSKSLNVPAVKILSFVSVEKAKAFATRLGLTFDKDDTGLSMALGGLTQGLSHIQIANSYLPFSRSGNFVKIGTVKKIVNKYGRTIYQKDERGTQVMGDDTAYLITDMLKETAKTGTAKGLGGLGFDIAAKTGTAGAADKTNTDIGAISYTTKNTVYVWFGNTGEPDENLKSTQTGSGTPIRVMKNIYTALPDGENFPIPNSVEKIEISTLDLDDHTVRLSPPEMSERYKKSVYLSKRYMPKQSSKFETLEQVTLTASVKDNTVTLSTHTKPYIKYELFKKQEDSEILIETVIGSSGFYTKQNTIERGNLYEYYCKATLLDKTELSNIVKVYLPPHPKIKKPAVGASDRPVAGFY